jgi:hypothetical protein
VPAEVPSRPDAVQGRNNAGVVRRLRLRADSSCQNPLLLNQPASSRTMNLGDAQFAFRDFPKVVLRKVVIQPLLRGALYLLQT